MTTSVDWSRANCAGTYADMFYYNAHESPLMIEHNTAENNPYTITHNWLRKVCDNCVIKNQCLEYALVHEEHGFWGGTSPAERAQIRIDLDLTLQEVYSPEMFDEYVIQSRLKQEETIKEEDYYGIY